jgi:hypothetical protein
MTTGTAGAIVQTAYEDAGKCAVGGAINAAQLSRGIDRLNDIINLWATQGLKLWLQQIVVVPLIAGQGVYVMGPGGNVNMTKPLGVLQGTYVDSMGVRQPLTTMSRDEWMRLSQLTNNNGAINSYFTNKRAATTDVSFWNTPDATAATGTVELLCRLQAGNVAISTDSVGFSPEWTIALRWGLADELATGQSDSIQSRCAQRAAAYRTALEDFDVEDADTYFTLDPRFQYGTGGFR